jgi:hypothetical protein
MEKMKWVQLTWVDFEQHNTQAGKPSENLLILMASLP